MSRLESVAPALAQRLSVAAPSAQRRASVVAADYALRSSGPFNADLMRYFAELESGASPGPGAESSLADLVETLDDSAWSIQEQVDAGRASTEEYLQAFGCARAAACLAYAVAGNASEAIYEAAATADDPSPLFVLVEAELSVS